MEKAQAIQLLERGMSANLGYGDGSLIEEFFENFNPACVELDFIPLLQELASRRGINFQDEKYFDDNSAGGFLHPTEDGKSFETEALETILVIKTNFEKLSPTAKKLVTDNAEKLDLILDEIINGDFSDSDAITILENIVREDAYLISNPNKKGFGALSKTIYLGEQAEKAIKKIEQNIKDGKL